MLIPHPAPVHAQSHLRASAPAISTAFGVGIFAVLAPVLIAAAQFFPADLQRNGVTASDWLFGGICLAALVLGNSVVHQQLTNRLGVKRAIVAGIAAAGSLMIVLMSVGSPLFALVRQLLAKLGMADVYSAAAVAAIMVPATIIAFVVGAVATILFRAPDAAPHAVP